MHKHAQAAFFGPYRLIRPLAPSRLGERHLALHVRRQTSHVVHRFRVCRDRVERRRFTAALEALTRLAHPHLLRVEQFSFGAAGRPHAVTPYTGSHDGLLTLRMLLDQKGGRLSEFEALRLLEHLLDASAHAHEHGLCHGGVDPEEVLIDRSGCVLIEHYGLARAIHADSDDAGARNDEVLSILRLGYEALTGVVPQSPMVRPTRLIRLADREWDAFFEACLDGAEPLDPVRVLARLPGRQRRSDTDADRLGPVRVALRRLARAAPAMNED